MAVGHVDPSSVGPGRVRAAEGYVLVAPVEQTDSGIIVVSEGVTHKGVCVSLGNDVPEFHEGDLIYFKDGIQLEVGITAVRWDNCIAYSCFHEDAEEDDEVA